MAAKSHLLFFFMEEVSPDPLISSGKTGMELGYIHRISKGII